MDVWCGWKGNPPLLRGLTDQGYVPFTSGEDPQRWGGRQTTKFNRDYTKGLYRVQPKTNQNFMVRAMLTGCNCSFVDRLHDESRKIICAFLRNLSSSSQPSFLCLVHVGSGFFSFLWVRLGVFFLAVKDCRLARSLALQTESLWRRSSGGGPTDQLG